MSDGFSSVTASPILLRKSTFANACDLCELNPNLYKKITANEEFNDHLEKILNPYLHKVVQMHYFFKKKLK